MVILSKTLWCHKCYKYYKISIKKYLDHIFGRDKLRCNICDRQLDWEKHHGQKSHRSDQGDVVHRRDKKSDS